MNSAELTDAGVETLSSLIPIGATAKSIQALKFGPSFSQYKSIFWSKNKSINRVLDPIEGPNGEIWTQYIELHHRFIPQRWQKKYNLPNWLVNNKYNLKPLNSLDHALQDPYRARFAPAWVKKLYDLKWK